MKIRELRKIAKATWTDGGEGTVLLMTYTDEHGLVTGQWVNLADDLYATANEEEQLSPMLSLGATHLIITPIRGAIIQPLEKPLVKPLRKSA